LRIVSGNAEASRGRGWRRGNTDAMAQVYTPHANLQ
jgi:hypothetical protein